MDTPTIPALVEKDRVIVPCNQAFLFVTMTVQKKRDGNKYAILFDAFFDRRAKCSCKRRE
jgi:hypothetical protein